jgi:DUF4097 and DUF4098 domain-containing protein YvlB
MRRPTFAAALFCIASATASAQLFAQTSRAAQFMDNCRRNRSDEERFCETRNVTLAATSGINVDGRDNGGISVHGWDKPQVEILAMIQTQAETQSAAESMAKEILVTARNGLVRADGPDRNGRHESWSVSYEVWAPRGTELSLTAQNGGISVDGVSSKMDLQTVNGGLSLVDVDGDVRGTTVNGGVTAELHGDRWTGTGLDLRTSNGGVRLIIPSNYSARLETGTVNGGMNVDFPITIQGSLGHRFSTQLGAGGAMIRAMTTNGGVSILRR